MSTKNKRLSPGAYVEVTRGVHDQRMPEGRRDGLILEVVGKGKDQALILFSNKVILKFHKSQLNILSN
jgi:hypothetical protein